MALTVTFLGHAGFIFDDGSHSHVIDPFLNGNPLAPMDPDAVTCQSISLTHGHEDHVGDSEAIAKRNNATIYAAFELAEFMGAKGIACEPMNPGGRISTSFGWIALTQAFHSSSYGGVYMGMPCGVVINIGGVTIYHCGDTGLFSDMKLIGEIYKPDIACIPIGDRFTMGPELASRAAEFIKPKIAVPIHYKTFPVIAQDASGFAPSGVEVKELEPGVAWSVSM